MTNIQKCGVIGVGFVGATCAYTLAVSGLFSDLVLVDMNRDKAIGEAADINHGVAFSKPCRVMAETMLTSLNAVLSSLRQAQTRSPAKAVWSCSDEIKASCPPSSHSLRQSIVRRFCWLCPIRSMC